jgi:hypothetical protein
MKRPGRRTLLLVPVLMAVAFGAVTAVQPAAAAALDPQDVHHCNGGAQRRALVDTKDAPTTIGENAMFVQVTDASIQFAGPANGTDQVIVIFTAEAALQGQPNVFGAVVDSLQVRILLDGVVLPPGEVVFTTDAGESDAVQACKLVGPGNHVVTVEWWLSDTGANNALTGTLSSFELHLEQNE